MREGNKNQKIGFAFEQRVLTSLKRIDRHPVRSSGSKGLFDLVSIRRDFKIRLVVCRNNGYLSPREREALKDFLVNIPQNLRSLYILELHYYISPKKRAKKYLTQEVLTR